MMVVIKFLYWVCGSLTRPTSITAQAAAVALTFAGTVTPASATPVTTEQGRWQITDQTSAIDNTRTYAAIDASNDEVVDLIGRRSKPMLGLVCSSKGLFLSLIWPDFLDNPAGSERLSMVAKTDDAAPETDHWIAAERSLSKPGHEALEWLNAHAKAHKLVVRAPDRHGGQEAGFDLDGLDVIMAKLNAMSCG